jgi:hypothetical protein
MKLRSPIFALALMSISFFLGCNMPPDKKDQDPNDRVLVEQTIHNVIGWAVEKDFDLLYSSLLNDSAFISVSPRDRVKFGFEAVKEDSAFWGSPDFKAIRHEIKDLRISFSKDNNVAWFYCVLDDINTWKGEPANWENARWTGVLIKQSGKWRMAQQHFSFPQ